jgi:hypothetical protein
MRIGLKRIVNNYLTNMRGWKTNRNIVLIESDDWGSIRMPSYNVYLKCLKAGYPVDKNPYERYDSLASEEDLELLFNILSDYKDINNKHPQITANCVVANPDFDKIRNCDFLEYHFELITETFKRYPKHTNNFEKWLKAKNDNIFLPQFHAREHINVSLLMNALRANDQDILWGFDHKMPGSIRKGELRNGNYFVEATRYVDSIDKQNKIDIYLDGLEIFEKLFGFKSVSIIPTNYTWDKDFDKFTKVKGVIINQGARKMKVPENNTAFLRYMGQKNESGQINLVRNCFFEPSLSLIRKNSVDSCLKEMDIAFKLNKPAIISSHRINYVGFVDQNNRDINLNLFSELIDKMLKKWPDIEFMNTVELGNLILKQ